MWRWCSTEFRRCAPRSNPIPQSSRPQSPPRPARWPRRKQLPTARQITAAELGYPSISWRVEPRWFLRIAGQSVETSNPVTLMAGSHGSAIYALVGDDNHRKAVGNSITATGTQIDFGRGTGHAVRSPPTNQMFRFSPERKQPIERSPDHSSDHKRGNGRLLHKDLLSSAPVALI